MQDIDFNVAQSTQLSRLWMIYGNNGPQHTHGNHKFIQHILEKNVYEPNYWFNIRASKLTQDCLNAVDEILFEKDERE